MKKINYNGWTILLLEKDLIVYKGGEQRNYTIKEKNYGIEYEEGSEYFTIRTAGEGFYYQFKMEEDGSFIGDKFTNDDEFMDTFACFTFGEN
jgi:hypothetical protein